jgi:His-Xaa-Ser system protein HxsD
MRRMPLMHPMPLAATSSQSAPTDVRLEFDKSTQTLGALESAAYRLIGVATCQIECNNDRFVCRLTPKIAQREQLSGNALRERFLDLVTDENLRLRIAEKTDGVRNVILALAFGSLASSQDDKQ